MGVARAPVAMIHFASNLSKQGSAPTLGCGVCETKSKMGAPDPENPLFLGFYVLRRALRPWSQCPWSPKGPDHGVGVDPETVKIPVKFSEFIP